MPVPSVSVAIVGDSGSWDEYNPFFVASKPLVPRLLYFLNHEKLSIDELTKRLRADRKRVSISLQRLLRINAITEERGTYKVNFTILSEEDIVFTRKAINTTVRALATEIRRHKREIEEVMQKLSSSKQVNIGKMLFAVVGCFALDWKCLEKLGEKGFLMRRKRQPGDRNYILYGVEQPLLLRREKRYTGSHSDVVENYTFTSFGGPGFRYAFPDAIWVTRYQIHKLGRFKSYKQKLLELLNVVTRGLLKDVGELLFNVEKQAVNLNGLSRGLGFREGQTKLLVEILRDMKYLRLDENGLIRLNYPVFSKEDKALTDEVSEIVVKASIKILNKQYDKLKSSLRELTPIKNGVDFREVFNVIWHDIFGEVNKVLAESGFMYDPPPCVRGGSRCIAWVTKS
jgi:hypothetical protein